MFCGMKTCIVELYQTVVGTICRITGVSEVDIIHSNREECVDARFILVRVLSERLTDNEIASLLKRTRQGINFIRNTARMRKWSVANDWQAVSKELASNYYYQQATS